MTNLLPNPSFKTSFFISVFVHFLLLGFAFFISIEHRSYFSFSPIYQVSLVEMPPLKKDEGVKGKAKIQPQNKAKPPQVAKKTQTPPAKQIEQKKTQTLKAIPLKKDKNIAKQNEKKAKSVLESKKKLEMAAVSEKIKMVEKRVRKKQANEGAQKEVARIAREIREGKGGEIIGEFIGGKLATKGISLGFQLYYAQIWEQLRGNWILPTFLLKQASNLEAIIIIKIDRDGHMINCRFEKKSGDALFDHSVEEALKKADPLPPLPKDYSWPNHEVGVRFKWTKEEIG
jgi:TonB family protein